MPAETRSRASIYSVHPALAMVQDWLARLRERTGRSLEEWLHFIEAEGPADEKGRRAWLKDKHGLGTNYAAWLAARSVGKNNEDEDPEAYLKAAAAWVEALYAGPKAALWPLHDRLIEVGLALGDDVRICPCKTMVPFYRKHVFAQIKPATRTRIDLGFALGDTAVTGRLIDTGGFAKKDRITHRIPITCEAEIDKEVLRWLKVAYERDGE